jgi:hypothetical protein
MCGSSRTALSSNPSLTKRKKKNEKRKQAGKKFPGCLQQILNFLRENQSSSSAFLNWE